MYCFVVEWVVFVVFVGVVVVIEGIVIVVVFVDVSEDVFDVVGCVVQFLGFDYLVYFVVGNEGVVYVNWQVCVWWQVEYVVVVEQLFGVFLVEDGV